MLKYFSLLYLLVLCDLAKLQSQINWNQYPEILFASEHYANHPDAVIADEHTEVIYRGRSSVLKRFITYCVRSDKGAKDLSTFIMPENFDPAYSKLINRHGRTDLNTGADLYAFKVKSFGARMLKEGRWEDITTDYKYVKRRWLKVTGEIVYDEMPRYTLNGVAAGTFLQICYEAQFDGYYGEDIYYFYHTEYPKSRASYEFRYYIDRRLDKLSGSIVLNLADSCVQFNKRLTEHEVVKSTTIRLHNIAPINYPQNAFEQETQPHIVFDLSYGIFSPYAYNSANSDWIYLKKFNDFNWMVNVDTTVEYKKQNTTRDEDLRKYYRKLPPLRADTGSLTFLKAYRDTIVGYRYLSIDQLYYNEDHLLNVNTISHFNRRRYPPNGGMMLIDILFDNDIPYSTANVIDKRYGNHSLTIRAHYPYERSMLALPVGKKYLFFIGPHHGLKYFVDELPFYYEGRLAVVRAITYGKNDSLKTEKALKFIKTKNSTENDNTRIENANISVDTDAKTIQYAGRISLSGQYSTLLRPLYLKDPIDSSVSKAYFKKCTEKPGASEVQIKSTARSSDYPFRHNFACSEKFALANAEVLNMRDWFSFSLNRELLPQTPSADYYYDFVFSDLYNFVLNFSKPSEITNLDDFTKTISNKYFDYSAAIVKQEGNSYLVKVSLQLRTIGVRIEDVALLEELLQALDYTNNFQLKFKAL